MSPSPGKCLTIQPVSGVTGQPCHGLLFAYFQLPVPVHSLIRARQTDRQTDRQWPSVRYASALWGWNILNSDEQKELVWFQARKMKSLQQMTTMVNLAIASRTLTHVTSILDCGNLIY